MWHPLALTRVLQWFMENHNIKTTLLGEYQLKTTLQLKTWRIRGDFFNQKGLKESNAVHLNFRRNLISNLQLCPHYLDCQRSHCLAAVTAGWRWPTGWLCSDTPDQRWVCIDEVVAPKTSTAITSGSSRWVAGGNVLEMTIKQATSK